MSQYIELFQGMLMAAQGKRLFLPALRPDPPRLDSQGERGASVVEFAIVLSLLFLIIFGIIQFGIAFNRDNGIKSAAREGARAAAVGASEDQVGKRVREMQEMFLDTDVNIAIEWSNDNGANYSGICDDATSDKCTADTSPCGSAGIGNLVKVTATVPGSTGRYAIVIPFWGNAEITFIGDGVFRCENKT